MARQDRDHEQPAPLADRRFQRRFQRGSDQHNEHCLGCGNHIRRHYGGLEYRCHPLSPEAEASARLAGALVEGPDPSDPQGTLDP